MIPTTIGLKQHPDNFPPELCRGTFALFILLGQLSFILGGQLSMCKFIIIIISWYHLMVICLLLIIFSSSFIYLLLILQLSALALQTQGPSPSVVRNSFLTLPCCAGYQGSPPYTFTSVNSAGKLFVWERSLLPSITTSNTN